MTLTQINMLVDASTGEPIEKATDVSFVNNLGHSWIQQIEVYLNDKQIVDLSTPSMLIKHSLKII